LAQTCRVESTSSFCTNIPPRFNIRVAGVSVALINRSISRREMLQRPALTSLLFQSCDPKNPRAHRARRDETRVTWLDPGRRGKSRPVFRRPDFHENAARSQRRFYFSSAISREVRARAPSIAGKRLPPLSSSSADGSGRPRSRRRDNVTTRSS